MLAIDRLTKTYPAGVRALDEISLEIPPGVFGLLGPNGAGKSTLMKILATLLEADYGSAELYGVPITSRLREARRMLGYLPQDFGFHDSLTTEQTLDYFARLKGLTETRERGASVLRLLELVNLAEARKQRVGDLSGGMRQRLGIAQALLANPRLIIVDEPTVGLDPEERHRFHSVLHDAAGEGTVVLLSTHIVSDVSSVCSRLAVIAGGRILSSTTTAAALESLGGRVWQAHLHREQLTDVKTFGTVISSRAFGPETNVRLVAARKPPLGQFKPAEPMLEDYYFQVIAMAGALHSA
jgi:ABC-2 type transport system ATP-binding protein